ncbi:hypothetical protein O6H91_13G023100 [Diphasiastrum complanatum]|uniref:Uncharacterized protein n=1 Tax=Diphasiastrum complanatum TaxID=34168 RepID=A0ACC2BSY8_DIPCM|nr:hypothetical protein O6H91_13G023100 [Diphasiastrum complanatum]
MDGPMMTTSNGVHFQESIQEQPLFGGAIRCTFPLRFKDVSIIREVPNNQEVFADLNRDESIIVELLEMKHEVSNQESALWFLQDLANEQDASQDLVVERLNSIPLNEVPYLSQSTAVTTAVGKMRVSKGRQGAEARNVIQVYLGNIRLPNVNTDILITLYEPLVISELSHSAASVGAGETVPAVAAGCLPAAEIFRLILATFRVLDWSLFGV